MDGKIIYRDTLVEITNDAILLKKYTFPGFKDRTIPFQRIEKIEAKRPTIWTGKWRFFGTGDIRTWFPLDNARNTRETIFIITLKHEWFRSGFTVEDSHAAQNILKEKGLLH
jgi:hypothetical protein